MPRSKDIKKNHLDPICTLPSYSVSRLRIHDNNIHSFCSMFITIDDKKVTVTGTLVFHRQEAL